MSDQITLEVENVITKLRTLGKDTQHVEVKESKVKLPKSIAETISAFANGSGGTIILGLSEENNFSCVMGFNAARIADALAHVCSNSLTPAIRPQIEIVKFEGSHIVSAIIPEILPRDKPCYIINRGKYQGAYIRVADGDRRLTPYEIDCLLEGKTQPKHDLAIVSEASIDDLDSELVAALLARQRELHPRVFAQLSKQDALLSLRVIGQDENKMIHPTLASLLALGSYPQQFFPRLTVTFAAFSGTSKASSGSTRFLDSQTMAGSIPVVLEETLRAVGRNMRVGGKVEGAFRKDVPDYPSEVVREAVCNALMHRDYSSIAQGSQVQVNMYADRLEVINPGGLFGAITVDQLGCSGISSTRNQHLSAILESTPYGSSGYVAENRGTGYQFILEQLKLAGMQPPKVRDHISFFSLEIMRKVTHKSRENESFKPTNSKAVAPTLSKIEIVLQNEGEMSPEQLSQATGLPRRTLGYQLDKLITAHKVVRTQPLKSPQQTYRLV